MSTVKCKVLEVKQCTIESLLKYKSVGRCYQFDKQHSCAREVFKAGYQLLLIQKFIYI